MYIHRYWVPEGVNSEQIDSIIIQIQSTVLSTAGEKGKWSLAPKHCENLDM